jgi:hypothetical protein
MGMKFSIATASDVLSKGLDPKHPHRDLGHDGMLKAPSTQEAPKASTVVSVSAPVETTPTPPPVVEAPVLSAKKEEEALPVVKVKEPEEKVVSEPSVSVSVQTVEKTEEKLPESTEDKKSVVKTPKAKASKTPAQ